jgi:hypothetical protein
MSLPHLLSDLQSALQGIAINHIAIIADLSLSELTTPSPQPPISMQTS